MLLAPSPLLGGNRSAQKRKENADSTSRLHLRMKTGGVFQQALRARRRGRSRGGGLRRRKGAIPRGLRRCLGCAERLGDRGKSNIAKGGREWDGSRF